MINKIDKEYQYTMKWGSLILLFIIGAFLGSFLIYQAFHYEGELTIGRIVRIGNRGASILYYSVAIFMYLLAVLAIVGIIEKLRGRSLHCFFINSRAHFEKIQNEQIPLYKNYREELYDHKWQIKKKR